MAMSRPYRPSNGMEGWGFEARWCERCERDRAFRDGWEADLDVGAEESCPILANAMAFHLGDPGYPPEWITGEKGPRCTGFVARSDTPYRCDRTADLFTGAAQVAE